jgi:asparagine synthase (glutamine-hydrolysing)
MVQQLHPGMNYKSFSIYYDGHGDVDERPFINEVIKKYPSVEPVYFKPTDDEVHDQFLRALYHADVPAAGSSFISQYFLMQLIQANGIKVVLDGQGADEFLGGYMHSFYRLVGGLLSKGKIARAIGVERAINNRLGNNSAESAAHFAKSLMAAALPEQALYSYEYKKYFPFLTHINPRRVPFKLRDPEGTRLTKFLYHLVFSTSLPSLLQYEDRNSMAYSVESRVPFLDHRLVEFCFSLEDEDKIHGIETKYILRQAMKPVLPQAVFERKDKKGFVTPGENKWLRGPLKRLLENQPGDLPFIRKSEAMEVLNAYKAGDNSRAALVWRLAVLSEWMKTV